MKKIVILLTLLFLCFVCGTLLAQDETAQTNDTSAGDIGWPREIKTDDNTILIYQPQIEKWEDNILDARSAFSVQGKVSPQSEYGIVSLSARTEVDKESRLVSLEDIKITDISFPARPEAKNEYLQVISENLPLGLKTIALDRLQANLAITDAGEKAQNVEVKNEPPKIIFSTTPAVLILIDGKPVLRQAEGTDLLRIINTRSLILLDEKTGHYYIAIFGKWISAVNLDGPWSIVQNVPSALEKAKETAVSNKQVDLKDKTSDEIQQGLDKGILPAIYVSTVPAELIVTNGSPQFEPITETQLLYVQNTSNQIFLYTPTQENFVLVSGRWFKSKSMNGPWTYVSGKDLPSDFAKVPETHPKGDILVSISGTPQAQESVIANTIPQTAAVKKDQAKLTVTYDGRPQFRDIEGTIMQYAVNCPTPVIKIDDKTYYAVDNGIWFVSSSPEGPWAVAESVPAVIYTIPVSSPLHYVTYVKIYNVNPDIVYVGYTPGYYGSYITPDGVVVYGTGWYYPPYIGDVWIGAPITYGVGAEYSWGFVDGWTFGFLAGFAWGSWCNPWWGPYWGWGWDPYCAHVNVNHLNVYNKWGNNVVINKNVVNERIASIQGRNIKGLTNVRNNIYAGRDGHIYRKDEGAWQKYSGGDRWNAFESKSEKIPVGRIPGRIPETVRQDFPSVAQQRFGGGDVFQEREMPKAEAVQERWGGERNTDWLERQDFSRSRGNMRVENFRMGGGGFPSGGFSGGIRRR